MDSPKRVSFLGSVRSKQSAVGAMAAGLRELKLTLYVTELRSDCSYAI
jgi:hypothetical protein